MAEIDELLSSTLKRVAQPGDPAGVADAIRSRVDAGDTGTPAAASGFGGGVASWLPWVGLVVAAGLVGGALGATGVFGAGAAGPAPSSRVSVLTMGSVENAVDASGCPAGEPVVRLEPGQRVLLVVRDDESEWIGVRDPLDISRTVWLPVGVVAIDEGEPGVDTLPVGGCPAPVLADEEPAPVPTQEPAPGPTPQPEPEPEPEPADSTGPALSQTSASPNPISMQGFPECGATVSTVSVIATDPSGVGSVSASWPGGGAPLSPSGSYWSFPFSAPAIGNQNTVYPITLTAVDAVGNASSTSVNVTVLYCLI